MVSKVRRTWGSIRFGIVLLLRFAHTSRVFALSCSALLVLLMIPSSVPVVASSSLNSCDEQVASQIDSLSFLINDARAVSLALSSPQLAAVSKGYSLTFNSLFNRWSFDSTCKVTWISVNVVFARVNSTGFTGYVVVSENPSQTEVNSVTLQQQTFRASGYQRSSINWSGYQFAGALDNGTTAVWEAIADWAVPTVSTPYSGACQSTNCDYAVWIGLTHDQSGAAGIAQTGSDGQVNSLGGATYQLWYEFYPNNAVFCFNMGGPGDSIHAYVLNQAVNPGGNSNLYNILVSDNTQGQSCSVPNQNFGSMGTPHLGNFIGERAKIGGVRATLAQFTSYSMSGSIYYSGSTTGIYTPYSNGWYTQFSMVNAGSQNTCSGQPLGSNICVSAVNTSNSFTQTWVTSQGT